MQMTDLDQRDVRLAHNVSQLAGWYRLTGEELRDSILTAARVEAGTCGGVDEVAVLRAAVNHRLESTPQLSEVLDPQ